LLDKEFGFADWANRERAEVILLRRYNDLYSVTQFRAGNLPDESEESNCSVFFGGRDFVKIREDSARDIKT
jgi:hypothetical protein